MSEMDSVVLLLHGIAQSMYWSGESESQSAIHGIFMYEASMTAYLSDLGSVIISNLGSRNLEVF